MNLTEEVREKMSVWQVSAVGWGFAKSGKEPHCEIAGFVCADDHDETFSKACAIAKVIAPELLQAVGPFPRPVINAEQIQEVPETEGLEISKVEVYWTGKEKAVSRPEPEAPCRSHHELSRRLNITGRHEFLIEGAIR
nr:hypothetical protein [uncultured Duganella sp.]